MMHYATANPRCMITNLCRDIVDSGFVINGGKLLFIAMDRAGTLHQVGWCVNGVMDRAGTLHKVGRHEE